MNDLPLVELPDRAAWRAWLQANHGSSQGIWLAVGKKGNGVTSLTYDEVVEEALCFGWIDSTVNRMDDDRFKQLLTPRKPNSTWSRSNKARVQRLAEQGLMTPAGLAAIETAQANGSWQMLDEVEALVVPEDLAAVLDSTPGATDGFESLGESARKMALYWIASAKRPETRAKRIARTVAAASQGRGPL
jgi:uncharacterized protein YdeI (YjbR/CyaY-like superfamily)